MTFQGSDARLTVRIADSPDEQRQGLMGVEDLSPDRGMAFVYDEPTTGSFWMKDTPIPLSIAFVDETDRIVGIEEMTPCTSEPCATWDAGGAAYTLAVEANAEALARYAAYHGPFYEQLHAHRLNVAAWEPTTHLHLD